MNKMALCVGERKEGAATRVGRNEIAVAGAVTLAAAGARVCVVEVDRAAPVPALARRGAVDAEKLPPPPPPPVLDLAAVAPALAAAGRMEVAGTGGGAANDGNPLAIAPRG